MHTFKASNKEPHGNRTVVLIEDSHIPVPHPIRILSEWMATTHYCHLSPQLFIVYLYKTPLTT